MGVGVTSAFFRSVYWILAKIFPTNFYFQIFYLKTFYFKWFLLTRKIVTIIKWMNNAPQAKIFLKNYYFLESFKKSLPLFFTNSKEKYFRVPKARAKLLVLLKKIKILVDFLCKLTRI